jgi:DNA primase
MPCPACKSGGDRALVVTAAKQAFYCFATGEGGDVIGLVAHIKGISMKEAAAFLAASFGKTGTAEPPSTVPSHSSPKNEKAGQPPRLNPLTYLQAEHPLVQALGVSPDTAEYFGAGYAPKGIMRGRLAIPIHDPDGELLAYCGRSLKGEEPLLLFPSGFNPAEVIFNAHRAVSGTLTLVRDPLFVLKAHENGIGNVVSILTDTISAQQLKTIYVLMNEKGCNDIDLA